MNSILSVPSQASQDAFAKDKQNTYEFEMSPVHFTRSGSSSFLLPTLSLHLIPLSKGSLQIIHSPTPCISFLQKENTYSLVFLTLI